MALDIKIVSTTGGFTSLYLLVMPLPEPQWEYAEYRKMVKLGNQSLRGLGPRTVPWSFPLLSTAQIAQLETFKVDDTIFIQTLKRDGTTVIYEVQCNWIDPRQDGSHKPGFVGYRFGLDLEMIIVAEVP